MSNIPYSGSIRLHIYPDKFLELPCKGVEANDHNREVLKQLKEDMTTGMYSAMGRGIAAPQVGIEYNFFVMDDYQRVRMFVNPKIEETFGEPMKTMEGCLSFPGVLAKLSCRYPKIRISYQDETLGDSQEEIMEAQSAIIYQHEFDHLQGITFLKRMGSAQRTFKKQQFLKKLKKYKKLVEKGLIK